MLDGLFTPQEANIIKNIPLAQVDTENNLYWPLLLDGQYTYKSRYHFSKEEAELEQQRIPSSYETQLWKKLWSL